MTICNSNTTTEYIHRFEDGLKTTPLVTSKSAERSPTSVITPVDQHPQLDFASAQSARLTIAGHLHWAELEQVLEQVLGSDKASLRLPGP